MPSIKLTPTLCSTIRDLRKIKKKRGDELSKEIGKGASYISQIENGKIKEIDFDLLNTIFKKITDLSSEEYANFINDIIDSSVMHMSKKELEHEEWMHQFDYEIRLFPISDDLISYIKEHLQKLKYNGQEFIAIINRNRDLQTYPNPDELEPNKLKIKIVTNGNTYSVRTTIRFELDPNLIDDILSKKKRTINYITMQGIIYNLFLSENYPSEEAHTKCKQILMENGFLTIKERNKIVRNNIKKNLDNENFTFYDAQPTDYDKKYHQLKNVINDGFDFLRDNDLLYAVQRMEQLTTNMKNDLGFTIAVMASPLAKIPKEQKKDFWDEYTKLLKSYIPPISDSENQE